MQPSVIGMKELERGWRKVQIILLASGTAIMDGNLNAIAMPASFDAFTTDRVIVRVAISAAVKEEVSKPARGEMTSP